MENWAGQALLCFKFFYVYVDDIFITENWAGQELLCPKFFICM